MSHYEPIQGDPVSEGVAAFIEVLLPAAVGHLPADAAGAPKEPPVVRLDSFTPTYNGPPMGDRHGQADWLVSGTVIAERADQARLWIDRIMQRLFARHDDGSWVHPIMVDGQWVTEREPAAGAYDPAPSGPGIVALVLRFTIRTQRA